MSARGVKVSMDRWRAELRMNRFGKFLVHYEKRIPKALDECGVEYIVVGGLAVAWYIDDREPDDMDLLICPAGKHAVRRALLSLGVHVQDENAFVGRLVSLKRWGFYADLLTPREDDPPFSELLDQAESGTLNGHPARIVSRAHLIEMKRRAVHASEGEAQAKHARDLRRLTSQTETRDGG